MSRLGAIRGDVARGTRRVLRVRRVASASLAVMLGVFASSVATAQEPASEERPVVAVLPFRVHSADPAAALGDSLAELLRSRLEAAGRVRVLEAGASGSEPEAASGETRDTALRRLARSLGADFLITGSLTEIAGRFSLDVRVTPRDLGVESQTQVATAQGEEDLLARMDRVADLVDEQIAGVATARVASVELRGAAGLEGVLGVDVETRIGEVFDPLVLRTDLAALRAHPEVVSAKADSQRGPEGVSVVFDLVLADAGARQQLSPDERIAFVEIRGNRRIESDAIRARIASRPGDRFDPLRIAEDIEEIYGLGFFRNVTVFTKLEAEGRVLIFEVEENPVIRQISISGNDAIDSDEIREILTLTTGSSLDYPLLFENRQRIEALYRAQGYYLAAVDFEIDPLAESSVGVHFEVQEGEKQKLREIRFVGNEYFSDSELTAGFQTKTWRFWSYATSWFDRSGTYSEPLFMQDLRGVDEKYSNVGFLQAQVSDPDVQVEKDGITVVIDVVEGRQFHVGGIDVVGDSTVDVPALREQLRLQAGEVFNRSFLTSDIEVLTRHYQNRGFYFAQVTPLSDLSEVTDQVDVTFDVRKGPLYFIRRVDIGGNTITVDSVIRREIPVAEGELYSQRAVDLARARVDRLGYFEEVDFQMETTEEPDQLDVKVSVVERPTGSFSFGAGYSSQDGLVLNGSLSQTNLFGRGYVANLSVDFGRRTQRFFINLRDPYFLGTEFSLGTTVSRTNIRYNSFEQEQIGAQVILGHALSEDNRTRGYLRYGFDLRQLADNFNVYTAALIFREYVQDRVSSSMMGLTLTQDTRDDYLAATSGRLLQLSVDAAGIGGFSKFVRMEARGSWFLGAPDFLLDRSSFVVGARLGWAEPLNVIGDYSTLALTPDDEAFLSANPDNNIQPLDKIDTDLTLPLTERYFMGGLGRYPLRGFKARSVGPRRAILRRVTVRDEGGQYVAETDPNGSLFTPVGWDPITNTCTDDIQIGGNGRGTCNDLSDTEHFADPNQTDVVGGNKFIAASFEYRFPISETVGLQGVAFVDMGNAFAEDHYNLFDVTEWRYGTGAGIQWFSPFGPLALVLGFPLDRLSHEKSPVLEFSVGGANF